jgi:thiol-disulfide isomerase/thioredoxin
MMEKNPTISKKDHTDKISTGWLYTKRVIRDAFFLMGVVILVSWGQSFKFKGKALSTAALGEMLTTVSSGSIPLSPSSQLQLVFIFAPWCQVCHANADIFENFSSFGYEVKGLGVSYERADEVGRFVQESGFKPAALIASPAIEAELEKNLAIREFPTFIVLSRNGEVLTGWTGYTTKWGLWMRMWGIRFLSSHLL